MSLAHNQQEYDTMPDINQPHDLEPFEGRDVIGAKIKVTNAGDGLSQALAMDPVAYHHGAKVYVVLECLVSKVEHAEVKDTGALVRQHTFKAEGAVIVDAELVAGLVDQSKELIRKRKEEAQGIQTLPLDDPPETHPAVELLEKLKKDKLREIAEENGITVAKSWSAQRIIEALLDGVVNIEEVARHAVETDQPDSEATVTPISDAVKNGDDW